MFERSKTTALKDNAVSAGEFATSLAKDKKFRKELLSAISHGTIAQRRASRKIGLIAVVARLTNDVKLMRELRKMVGSLDKAWTRVEKKRSHKLRNVLILLGIGGVAAAATRPSISTTPSGTCPASRWTGPPWSRCSTSRRSRSAAS